MGKDGIIQIPRAELEATGLKEGDEVCLIFVSNYLEKNMGIVDEFLLDKKNL